MGPFIVGNTPVPSRLGALIWLMCLGSFGSLSIAVQVGMPRWLTPGSWSSDFFSVPSLGNCELRCFKEKHQCGESSFLCSLCSCGGQGCGSRPWESLGWQHAPAGCGRGRQAQATCGTDGHLCACWDAPPPPAALVPPTVGLPGAPSP